MTAPICGFDIGTENCYIGVARQGGIEIILNDFSQRSTPGYVCLLEKQRDLGVAAKQKQNTNLNSTFYNLRRIIGRQFHEVANEEKLAFPIEQAENGEVAVHVFIHGQEHVLTATQLLAMVLTKLKQLSNNTLECVINCPNYFTDSQRRALKHAATIANINVSRILPDLSAVALYYCFYRVNAKEENNQLIGFIDIGTSSTQCSIINYSPKKYTIQVLALEYESNLGGRTFDEEIANYFIQQKGLRLNKRSKIRLLAECEKLKKQMSANSNDLPINIECLYEDRDFSSKMDRVFFENLCSEQFQRIENVFRRVLASAISKLKKDNEEIQNLNFAALELVGGSSRIPAIRNIVKNVFGFEPSSTLNADEAVALGCTLQSALLSPNYRVLRNFQVIDYQPYQINCRYWLENKPDGKIHVISPFFVRGSEIPFTRQIIFNYHSLPIILELDYLNESNQSTAIGQYKIYSNENVQYPPSKIKIRVRLDNDGLIGITSASLNFEEPKEEENKDTNKDVNKEATPTAPAAPGTAAAATTNDKQTKNDIKTIKLEVQTNWIRGYIDDNTLDAYRTLEFNFVLADKNWNEKLDARNELEEYIYDWRDKVQNVTYQKFINSNDLNNFIDELKKTENWLFGDEESGAMQSKTVYQDLLKNLKSKYSDQIIFRLQQAESRQFCLEELKKCIQLGYKVCETEEQIDGLDNFKQTIENASKYFDEIHSKLLNLDLTQNPPVTLSEIQQKKLELDQQIKIILNKINEIKKAKEEAAAKKKDNEKMQVTPDQQEAATNDNNNLDDKAGSGDKQTNNESSQMDVDK